MHSIQKLFFNFYNHKSANHLTTNNIVVMVKDTYFVIGIIYLFIALIYFIGVIISTVLTIMNYISNDTEKDTDINSTSYKVYKYYNNFRYGIFVVFYLAIGILYILENKHSKH